MFFKLLNHGTVIEPDDRYRDNRLTIGDETRAKVGDKGFSGPYYRRIHGRDHEGPVFSLVNNKFEQVYERLPEGASIRDGDILDCGTPTSYGNSRHAGDECCRYTYYRAWDKLEWKDAYIRAGGRWDLVHSAEEPALDTPSDSSDSFPAESPPNQECIPPDHVPEKPAWGRAAKSIFYLVLLPIVYGVIGKKP